MALVVYSPEPARVIAIVHDLRGSRRDCLRKRLMTPTLRITLVEKDGSVKVQKVPNDLTTRGQLSYNKTKGQRNNARSHKRCL